MNVHTHLRVPVDKQLSWTVSDASSAKHIAQDALLHPPLLLHGQDVRCMNA